MAEQENTEIVKGIYEAFGRGECADSMNSLADEIEWIVSGREDGIPYAGTYRAREGVGQFFTLLAENVEYSLFEPREFIAQGDRVAVFGHYQGAVRPSGNSVETEWAMSWTLQEGKATKFRAYDDTAAVVAAFTMPSIKATASQRPHQTHKETLAGRLTMLR